MVIANLPTARPDHARALAHYALDLRKAIEGKTFAGHPIKLRMGFHSGAVVAGVIGRKRFAYDLWGGTVNIAARIQQTAEPGEIRISDAARKLLGPEFSRRSATRSELRGIGVMRMWRLDRHVTE